MSKIHKWWDGHPSERFWLEVTRRPDIGANLKAPQKNEDDNDFWSYSLINEVKHGDQVYHYDGKEQQIIARSLAVGVVWDDDVLWAARGLSARSARVVPHSRPGWYLGLEEYEQLSKPITLNAIRVKTGLLRSLTKSLVERFSKPLYFPFEIANRPVRPMQGYLFKLPHSFLDLFPEEIMPSYSSRRSVKQIRDNIGDEYREADELAALAKMDPFSIDPALVERGTRGHAITQNRLAEYLRSAGIRPRSPKPHEPNFDVAWQVGIRIFVAEVKSLTFRNEEKQLRLGLGQVLRYAHQFGSDTDAIPVLVVERCPSDTSWISLCKRLNVILVWPEVLAESPLTN